MPFTVTSAGGAWIPDNDEILRVMLPRGGCVLTRALALSTAAELNVAMDASDGPLAVETMRAVVASSRIYGVPLVMGYAELARMMKAWIRHASVMRDMIRMSNEPDHAEYESDHEAVEASAKVQSDQSNEKEKPQRVSKRVRSAPMRLKPY